MRSIDAGLPKIQNSSGPLLLFIQWQLRLLLLMLFRNTLYFLLCIVCSSLNSFTSLSHTPRVRLSEILLIKCFSPSKSRIHSLSSDVIGIFPLIRQQLPYSLSRVYTWNYSSHSAKPKSLQNLMCYLQFYMFFFLNYRLITKACRRRPRFHKKGYCKSRLARVSDRERFLSGQSHFRTLLECWVSGDCMNIIWWAWIIPFKRWI